MVDYITLMAKKMKKTKSDWMLEKWADANGYLDDPEPSVDLALKEESDPQGDYCELCGEKGAHPIPGGITLCQSCDDKTNPSKPEQDDENGDTTSCPECQYDLASIDLNTGDIYCSACGYRGNELDEPKEEAGKNYGGTCPRCNSDNTKKTKSQTGTTIGLCNDCGETWKLKEAVSPNAQKGGEIPLGKTGEAKSVPDPTFEPGAVKILDKGQTKKEPDQEMIDCPWCHGTGEPSRIMGHHIGTCSECHGTGKIPKSRLYPEKIEEPDPSNPDKELNPDPKLPEPETGEKEPTDDDDSQIHMKPQTYTADGVELPDKIEIPERLYNDLMMMIEYSVTNDNEAGGFLIVAEHGKIGVVGEQFGKDREIVLEPNEQLHEGEQLIGTVHMHPVTPTASTGDVTGYLNDENEKVMVVVGADKSINFFFKVPDITHEGDYGDEISDNFEQEDMDIMAEGFGFIWYRGEESDRTELHLMDNVIDDLEFEVLEESWPVEQVIKALGIKGRPDIPEEYSTKKTPLRLSIPFSYCPEKRYLTLKATL